MARSSTTIVDVANAAGVSRQTVSRVINQKTNVSADARERVEAAIDALGYVPNLAARRMGGARSYTLLALIERGAARAAGGHLPLGEMLLAGIETCSKQGYHLLFEQLETGTAGAGSNPELARRLAAVLGSVQPDGVIVMPPLDESIAVFSALEKRGVASACLGERLEKGRKVPGLDETIFGEAAAQRLVDLGHRQVGFVAGVTEPERSLRRLEGYRNALARAGSRAHRHFVAKGAQDYVAALKLARGWLMPTIRPTAIIAETPEVALAFLQVAGELKIAVPRELSILSLTDNSSLDRAVPPVSALFQPYGAMFARACAALMNASAGAGAAPAATEVAAGNVPGKFEFADRKSLAKAPRAV
ncbi:LacI family DNA-binding transcriptional regulator [Qipengyuania sp. ASV99]|uniref:LacI family DNA-binding transcriptional regulator n=1 Tax=Qipengyuania sp. ASV99 TaxID=3399681 RepID=UPI003A4C54DA